MPVLAGQSVCKLSFGRSAVQIKACNSLEPRTVAATDSCTPWKWWVKPRTPSVYAPRQERVTLPWRGSSLVSTAHPSKHAGFPGLPQAEAECSGQLRSVQKGWGRQVRHAVCLLSASSDPLPVLLPALRLGPRGVHLGGFINRSTFLFVFWLLQWYTPGSNARKKGRWTQGAYSPVPRLPDLCELAGSISWKRHSCLVALLWCSPHGFRELLFTSPGLGVVETPSSAYLAQRPACSLVFFLDLYNNSLIVLLSAFPVYSAWVCHLPPAGTPDSLFVGWHLARPTQGYCVHLFWNVCETLIAV